MKKIYGQLSRFYPVFPYVLVLCFLSFTVLSWILLFRDKRAISTISSFYPQLGTILFDTRNFLLAHNLNTIPTFIFAIGVLVTFFFYVLSLQKKFQVKRIILFSIIFQFITFFSYPILSTDIFSYMFSDRVATTYHQNVWKVPPGRFPKDPFAKMSDWKTQIRVYGEVNQLVYDIPAELSGNDWIAHLVSYKLVAFVFSLATLFIFYKIVHEFLLKKEAFFLVLIFWNPLYILEIAGTGHNDILMLFFSLIAVYCFMKKNIFWSGIALALAVQVKVIPGLLFLIFLVDLFKQKKYKSISLLLLAFGVINIIAFYLMDIDPVSFFKAISSNTGVYWQGLPAVIHKFFPQEKIFVIGGFVIVLLSVFYRQLKVKSEAIDGYVTLLLVYLLFFASAYWNWYILWAFLFLPFIKSKKLQLTIIVFTFTSLLLYPTYWLALRFNYQNIVWSFVFYLVMAGLPILTFFFGQNYARNLLKD